MIAQITKAILAKMLKIGHNSALKAAILDFGIRKVNLINPCMTLYPHANNENDTTKNKGDIAPNYENRPYSALKASILDFGKGQIFPK